MLAIHSPDDLDGERCGQWQLWAVDAVGSERCGQLELWR
jgi:hypothetical protein